MLSIVACGDEDGPTDPGSGDAEARGTVDASGGTLTASDGSFSLTVPAGALSEATEIIVSELQVASLGLGTTLRSFDFEPDDLTFVGEVTLTLDLPGDLSRV